MSEIDKILCMPSSADNNAMTTAMLANNGMNNAWNNPFIYLVWMMMLGRNGLWGNNDNCASKDISTLQNTVTDNHNNDIALQAINGSTQAVRDLASQMGCSVNSVQTAVNGVKSAIDLLSGQTGYSAESVKNAILMGNQTITSKLADCCCQTKEKILTMGYENQLANERQTNTLQQSIENVRQATVNGFSQLGYQMQADKCDIIQAGNANTQRIVDTLNAHWTSDLQQKYSDAKLELSQLNQNATLIAALKGSTTTA